jgi:hypothetical protein
MTRPVDPYDLPSPTSEKKIAERRYKKAIGVVAANDPIDKTHISLIFSRWYDHRKLEPILQQACRNGHLQRDADGRYLATDAVRY